MPSIASWNISICLKFVPSFGHPRRTTTGCLRSYWESSIATHSVSRLRKGLQSEFMHRRDTENTEIELPIVLCVLCASVVNELGETDVHHEEIYFTQNSSESRRSRAGAPVPGCDGSCRHGSFPNGGGSQTTDGLLLYS